MAGVRGKNGFKSNVTTIASVERAAKALELRKKGYTYREISAELGYAKTSSSYDAVQKALRRTIQEPADDVRKLEAERLDQLQKGLWDRASSGDQDAIETMLRLMNRRAKLLGLDAPTRIAHSDPDGHPFLTGFAQALHKVYGQDRGPAGPDALPDHSA